MIARKRLVICGRQKYIGDLRGLKSLACRLDAFLFIHKRPDKVLADHVYPHKQFCLIPPLIFRPESNVFPFLRRYVKNVLRQWGIEMLLIKNADTDTKRQCILHLHDPAE